MDKPAILLTVKCRKNLGQAASNRVRGEDQVIGTRHHCLDTGPTPCWSPCAAPPPNLSSQESWQGAWEFTFILSRTASLPVSDQLCCPFASAAAVTKQLWLLPGKKRIKGEKKPATKPKQAEGESLPLLNFQIAELRPRFQQNTKNSFRKGLANDK